MKVISGAVLLMWLLFDAPVKSRGTLLTLRSSLVSSIWFGVESRNIASVQKRCYVIPLQIRYLTQDCF